MKVLFFYLTYSESTPPPTYKKYPKNETLEGHCRKK